jgi:YegS/Rv2252/BmrU family lipid kinase
MKNIAFIINPISGTQQSSKRKLPKLIEKELDHSLWLPNIVFTEYAGHATELARQFAVMGFDAVVAVGGDGTVNEVAQGLRGSQTALGILPYGSGNGFARHLHIPMSPQKAIQMLNHSEPVCCDYGLANDRMFVTTCGTGFDAQIAYRFAGAGKRGFATYIEKVVKDMLSYKSQTYHIVGDNLDITHKAFLITFANASQWGNDAYIAPKASVQDGKMDICMMSSSALLGAPGLALRLFTKNIDNSLFMDTVKAKDVMLYREDEGPFHLDGDPVKMPKDIRIRIVEDGIRVLVEKRF